MQSVNAVGHATRARKVRRATCAVLALLAAVGVGCHHPVAVQPHPKAAPQARAATEPGALTDQQWVDSVAAAWAAARHSAPRPVAAAARTKHGPTAVASEAQSTSAEPSVTATAFAEAAPPSVAEESAGGPDGATALAFLLAVGGLSLALTIAAGRVALRPA